MVESQRKSSALPKSQVYDLLGIGFGPANLALMTAIEEEGERCFGHPLDCLFLESKPAFAWHPEMLIPGAKIQLSFLKDLVTLRNPRSRFTFLSYLQEKGRLDQFVNLREFFPSRIEFNDYYGWVAEQLKDNVSYNTESVSVQPVAAEDGSIELLKVAARDLKTGEKTEYLTRNLAAAPGGVPEVPAGMDLASSQGIFHPQTFLKSVHEKFQDRNGSYRFVVVGSGQSAAEIFTYLYERYPNADVTAVIRRFAYKPADDSHFVNEIFFPKIESFLYDLPAAKRRMIIDAHRDTNYSCVDIDLIEKIYSDLYQEKVAGRDRFRIRSFLELARYDQRGSELVLEFRDVVRDQPVTIATDGVVLATGFKRPSPPAFLGELSKYLILNEDGRCMLSRHYRVETAPQMKPRIFLQGFSEGTHGLSDTLLSTLSKRSIDILRGLYVESLEREGSSTQSAAQATYY